MKKILVGLLICMVSLVSHARVQELGDNTVLISGDIFIKDAEQFEKIKKIDRVLLDSRGGSFNSAIRIADKLLKSHSNADVIITNKCYSACTIILFSVPYQHRMMVSDSVLKIHNVSVDFQSRSVSTKVVTPVMNEVARASAFIALMYNNVGIPQPIILKGMSRFQEDTLKITPQELLEWGSISKIVE